MNIEKIFPGVEFWNKDKLIDDLNAARKKLDNKIKMSETCETYLCGFLAGYNAKKICEKLGLEGDGKAIRTALSTEIYPYVRDILPHPNDLGERMELGLALSLLEQAGYKKYSSPPDSLENKVKLNADNPTMEDLENIIAEIREMTQDRSIRIQDIRRGCIELVLSGSPEGLKRLASLIESGELTEINGVRIISVESVVEPSKVVRLSNWWDNLVESGWSALEQVLSPQQSELATVRSNNVSNVSKGKLIDRTMLDGGFAVVLALKPEKLADGSFEIILRLYPTGELKHLPPGIELRMLYKDDDGNQVSTDTRAGSSDEWIELKFPGESGEEFGVEVVKEDISVIENFVI